MKTTLTSAILAAVIVTMLPLVGAVVSPQERDDARTSVVFYCSGKGTSAESHIVITHNGNRIGEVTLTCNSEHHRSSHLFTTELKPNDWHITIRATKGDSHNECSESGTRFPAHLACKVEGGSASVKIKHAK